ncbi:hypothetical protein [Streptomyces sp. NPDC002573]|uniref:hypothetical protein n=1 Tax=Streptomyces sp. NPDC002573 TaxID=3364651 RepID=UPI00368D3AEA
MPNALWVITGRGRLQWADEGLQGQLDFTGPEASPGLAAADTPYTRAPLPTSSGGQQVLVGDFAPRTATTTSTAGSPTTDSLSSPTTCAP